MTQTKYYIWICNNCKKQLSEDFMGQQCKCGVWTYAYAEPNQLAFGVC